MKKEAKNDVEALKRYTGGECRGFHGNIGLGMTKGAESGKCLSIVEHLISCLLYTSRCV